MNSQEGAKLMRRRRIINMPSLETRYKGNTKETTNFVVYRKNYFCHNKNQQQEEWHYYYDENKSDLTSFFPVRLYLVLSWLRWFFESALYFQVCARPSRKVDFALEFLCARPALLPPPQIPKLHSRFIPPVTLMFLFLRYVSVSALIEKNISSLAYTIFQRSVDVKH